MARQLKGKPATAWLTRDQYPDWGIKEDSNYVLRSRIPRCTHFGGNGTQYNGGGVLKVFCKGEFERLTNIRLKPGESVQIRISVEILREQ